MEPLKKDIRSIKEEDLLMCYDFICERDYSGERPNINLKNSCILHYVSRKVLNSFSIIFPYLFCKIKFTDNTKRVVKQIKKMVFDKDIIDKVFDELNIDKKYIFIDFKLVEVSKKQISSNQIRGNALINFYKKNIGFSLRKMTNQQIAENILIDIASFLNMTKVQLIDLIK